MNPRSLSFFLALQFAVLTILGCGAQNIDPEYLRWARESYDGPGVRTLGEGDRFEVRIYQEEDLSSEYTVSQQGGISFPLIGTVQVAGRTCDEIQAEIEAKLRDGYLRNPTVSCRIVEQVSLRVAVVGRVKKPGTFPYRENLTVVEALALAEGLSEGADEKRAIVTRVVDGELEEIEVPINAIMSGRAPNFVVWPNDTVFVPAFRLLQ